MFLSNLYEAMRDEYRRWRDGPPLPVSPPPRAAPLTSPETPATPSPTAELPASHQLAAVRNWSHPFGDKSSVFEQLTTLAKAQAGYFPLGRNGLWHGGVHFDSGTAGTVSLGGQKHVRCLADGEVIAYRIPAHTPKTTFYPAPNKTMEAPFASGFVLVRHRLEAPKIKDSPDAPPSLIFYSLYMHLADWASYLADTQRTRPTFWPESKQLKVKMTAKDLRPGHPEEHGLNLRHAPRQGKTIGFLPRGAAVTVSGAGEYRKLEGVKGPEKLQNPDGTLKGYVSFSVLQAAEGGAYRVSGELKVRATPDASGAELFRLPKDTEVTISGQGEFRKLETVAQYVRFASLESERVPESGRVVVLEAPIPIKASSLIGHLGLYQDASEEAPQEKLHLEVFACDNVETFFAKSREWANRLPEKEKTWLKLAKGTKAVTHQDHYSKTTPPNAAHPHTLISAPLWVPRAMLEGLPADRKIVVPASNSSKGKTWYRLDDLLLDSKGKALPKGWVCDEVGAMPSPWVSPWSWDGYEVIYNNDPPQNALAHFLLNLNDYFDEKELEQWRPLADASDKGPVRSRLLDIIDTDKNGIIDAKEVQKALSVPAYAQSISKLVIHYESEWYYQQKKWDSLDKVLGHANSTPILNWVAEKARIKELSWWGELAGRMGVPDNAKIYCINPISMYSWVIKKCPQECAVEIHSLPTIMGDVTVSHESFKYILETEGYGETPYVPGGSSGVTIGYGYDLGQQKEIQVRSDLHDIYPAGSLERLIGVVGKTGDSARNVVGSVRDIRITNELALRLATKMKARYAQLMVDVYPSIIDLHPHCQGAILSLVINRGNSFTKPDLESRVEMREISDALKEGCPEKIPSKIRAMKRLWQGKPGLRGLILRREEEAKLFERGLKCDC